MLREEKASGVERTVFAFTHVQPGRAASQGDPQIRGSYRPGRLPGYSLWPLCTHVRVCSVAQSRPTLCDPMDHGPPGSSVMGFSRREHRSGLQFPFPGDLPDPRTERASLTSPALAGRFFTALPPGKPAPKDSFTQQVFTKPLLCARLWGKTP